MKMNEQWREYEQQLLDNWVRDPRRAMSGYRMMYENSNSPFIIRVLNRIGDGTMTRGKKVSATLQNGPAHGWTKFINISLEGVKESDIDLAYGDDDTLADGISSLLSRGYRIGLSYDAARDCFIASLTCREGGDPNTGCTFTSFAGTWPQALKVMCYKHFEVCREIWPAHTATEGTPGFG